MVTYNRKELLRECVQALLAQTRPADKILILNNASTDGTPELLAAEFPASDFPQIQVRHLPQNIGGAGGFHEGLKQTYGEEFDWMWLMDDDTIAEPDALSELFAAHDGFEASAQPCMLASKVVWTDGSLHSMNISSVKRDDPESLLNSVRHSTMSIRSTTFVSLLMRKSVVETYGLPLADYFIWNDDAEYTGRVLRENFGVLVPSSVVTHKTVKKHTALDAPAAMFYYHVRNGIWALTRSAAWSEKEKTKQFPFFLLSIGAYLKRSRFSWPSLRAVGKGARDGVFKRPYR